MRGCLVLMYPFSHDNPTTPPQSNHANMLRDAVAITSSPVQLVKWCGRAVVQMAAGCVRQLPRILECKVDTDVLLSAFSYIDPASGKRVKLDGWPLGPGYHQQDEPSAEDASGSVVPYLPDSATPARLCSLEGWDAVSATIAKFILLTSSRKKVSGRVVRTGGGTQSDGMIYDFLCIVGCYADAVNR